MNRIALFIVAAATLFTTSVTAQENIGKNAKVTLVFDQELPNLPGKSLRVVLVEYGPGSGSPSHRHPSSAFIYARVLRTVEAAMSQAINWWGDLPPPMKEAIEQFRIQLGAAIDSGEFVRRALDRQVHETDHGKGPP
jgi:hypothetical protein